MSFIMRQVAHCDVCDHEWLTDKVPSHCAKCKSRKWNRRAVLANYLMYQYGKTLEDYDKMNAKAADKRKAVMDGDCKLDQHKPEKRHNPKKGK